MAAPSNPKIAGYVLEGPELLADLLRMRALEHRFETYTAALLYRETIRDMKRAGKLPAAMADAERSAERRLIEVADEMSDLSRPLGLAEDAFDPVVRARVARQIQIGAFQYGHELVKTLSKELTGDILALWEQMAVNPRNRALMDKIGRGSFEELVLYGRGLTPALPKDFEQAITYALKGHMFELAVDLNPLWRAEVLSARRRGVELLQVLPNPQHWHFSYHRTDIAALAFKDSALAAQPAALLKSLPGDIESAALMFSGVTTNLLKGADKSAWMIYDDGVTRIGIPLLFGESKGLTNMRDLVKQFPKDLERAGLGLAAVDGKPTIVLLIERPKLAALGPRELTAGQASRIERTGAEVRSINHGLDNADALAFNRELGKRLGKQAPPPKP